MSIASHLRSWLSALRSRRPRRASRARLEVEALEGRELLSGAPPAAGIYLRENGSLAPVNMTAMLNNPILDGVIIGVSWRDLEPQRGVFTLDALATQVSQWGQAGKKVILAVVPYGQVSDPVNKTAGGAFYSLDTPAWVFAAPEVKTAVFVNSATTDGSKIAVPEVWRSGFATTYMAPLVHALAARFNGNPYVTAVKIGLGHNGHMTAQPSSSGATAFLNAGWTAAKWTTYCETMLGLYQQEFTQTSLFAVAEKVLLRSKTANNYLSTEAALITEFARAGVSIDHIALDDTVKSVQPIYTDLQGAVAYAQAGGMRVGTGDDWPLWVPLSRRGPGPTEGHDAAYLSTSLQYAFGGVGGLPVLPTTMLVLQLPELLAADPNNTQTGEQAFDPQVFSIINAAREHLLANDSALFMDPAVVIQGAPATSQPVGTVIPLTASVTDPGATDFTYAWIVTLTGNRCASGTSSSFSFQPTAPGLYVVTLTVTDSRGLTSLDTVVVLVE